MNLLEETLRVIESEGLSPNDIKFIGTFDTEYGCTWDEFTILADIEYDSGFGAQEIASDLIVMFNDNTYLTRYEYDGSEHWSYTPVIKVPSEFKPIEALTVPGGMWCSMSDIHEIIREGY